MGHTSMNDFAYGCATKLSIFKAMMLGEDTYISCVRFGVLESHMHSFSGAPGTLTRVRVVMLYYGEGTAQRLGENQR